jgi:hypothetical protein
VAGKCDVSAKLAEALGNVAPAARACVRDRAASFVALLTHSTVSVASNDACLRHLQIPALGDHSFTGAQLAYGLATGSIYVFFAQQAETLRFVKRRNKRFKGLVNQGFVYPASNDRHINLLHNSGLSTKETGGSGLPVHEVTFLQGRAAAPHCAAPNSND